jgi:Ankyrin repeats (3 copies)
MDYLFILILIILISWLLFWLNRKSKTSLILEDNNNINSQLYQDMSIDDLNKLGDDGETPLTRAIRGDDAKAVFNLIKRGADPNICNAKKISPLHLAALFDNAESTQMLIEKGADPNQCILAEILGNQLLTPFDIALEHRNYRTAQILEKMTDKYVRYFKRDLHSIDEIEMENIFHSPQYRLENILGFSGKEFIYFKKVRTTEKSVAKLFLSKLKPYSDLLYVVVEVDLKGWFYKDLNKDKKKYNVNTKEIVFRKCHQCKGDINSMITVPSDFYDILICPYCGELYCNNCSRGLYLSDGWQGFPICSYCLQELKRAIHGDVIKPKNSGFIKNRIFS